MQENQHLRQHAQRISTVAALSDEVEDFGLGLEIVRSWQRCLNNGQLDPFTPRGPVVLESQTLRELQDRYDQLLRLSVPELINLASSLSGSGYAFIITDDQGLILHQVIADNMVKEFKQAGLWQGADWGEQQVGTNGIGTCISEKRPLTVHMDEHFLSQNIHLSCSAAPILDPHGRLLSVLDASCCDTADSRSSQLQTRALVIAYARIIEGRYFLREFRNQRVLRFHILLQGETGTGKDLFAQAMHRASRRKDKPFVALNCASIPESLVESELFGYKHGAFTGALREGRRGKLIESNGGTLFLDEIGDMPINLQSRLLRVLETEEVVPLGADQPIKVELNQTFLCLFCRN